MCFIVLLVLLFTQGAVAQEDSFTFKSGVSNVRIDVQVTENNEIIKGLTKEDFAIFDQGKQQPIVYFGRDAEPLSLLLMLDISGSTRPYIEQIASVAKDALRFLRPKDRVAIMAFARKTRVTLPWTSDMTEVTRSIRSSMEDQSVGASTFINDSLLDAAKYMDETAGEAGRRAVLILTDNLGLNYKSPDDPVIEAFFGADTVLNAIVVGKADRPVAAKGNTYANPDFTSPDVFRIADETGGEAIKASQAGQAFSRMIERIRTRYALHYRVPEGAKAGFRRVDVMLSPDARMRYPQAQLRHRRGYRVRQ